MTKEYSYINPDKIEPLRKRALEKAVNYEPDHRWSFLHSLIADIVEEQGGEHQSGYDGFYTMKEFDVSGAASRIELALDVLDEFAADKASNDKSG